MKLEDRLGAAIRAQTDALAPRFLDVDGIRTAAKRQTRRRAAAGVAALLAAVAIAWTSVVSDLGEKRTLPAIDVPEHPQSIAIAIPATRPDQVVVAPSAAGVSIFGFSFPARDRALGSGWSLTDAGAAPTGGRKLSFTVDTSERERIAQLVVLVKGAAFCTWAECLPKVVMTIDGQVVDTSDEGVFFRHAGWEALTPGAPHDVTVRLEGGDPASTELGVVVYEADS